MRPSLFSEVLTSGGIARPSRPFGLATAAGAAAHHVYELANGIGLVWQPELGLGRAAVFWTASLAAWSVLAVRGPRHADPVLTALAGASLAGVAAHFVLWPSERVLGGLRVLTEAEGLSPRQMPAYNTILWGWAIAAFGAVVLETPRGSRRWALGATAACLPLFALSAAHHFGWLKEQSDINPAWWNRAVR
ncbi:MAG: hypothetical protein ACYCSF_06645 [Acidimicrobiales bacterium]